MGIVKHAFRLRRVQYTHYRAMSVVALVFVGFIAEEIIRLSHRRFDSKKLVTWIPFAFVVLVVVSCRVLGFIGCKWKRRLKFARECL
ncbi:unnamed protein product [Linum trigynum]|uniref:Uncharacterized protein n=1 Tax=Linum trigynum TaxID=586398 RepID=A0AAV2CQC1_9ROSI